MSHPSLRELTEAVHGFHPIPDHARTCPECAGRMGKLRDELDLMRRAEGRRVPRAFRWNAVPVALAAGILLSITGLILLMPGGEIPAPPRSADSQDPPPPKRPTPEERVRSFLEGSPEDSEKAREQILAEGSAMLPWLVKARFQDRVHDRSEALRETIFTLKIGLTSDADRAAQFRRLSQQVSLQMDEMSLENALSLLRTVSGLNLVTDPLVLATSASRPISLSLRNTLLRTVLDALGDRTGLDYDFRYGVFFLSTPDRLWSFPKRKPLFPLSGELERSARSWVERLGADAISDREAATNELRKAGPAVLPLLEEGVQGGDAEIRARCEALVRELRPLDWASPIPLKNRWQDQKIAGSSKAVVDRIRSDKLGPVDFLDVPFTVLVDSVRDIHELNITVSGEVPGDLTLSFTLGEMPLVHVLEIITLPLGLDVRIDDAVIVIYKRTDE